MKAFFTWIKAGAYFLIVNSRIKTRGYGAIVNNFFWHQCWDLIQISYNALCAEKMEIVGFANSVDPEMSINTLSAKKLKKDEC